MNLLNIKKQMNEIANFKRQKTNFQYLISNIQNLKIEFCCLEFIWDLFFVNWNFNTDELSFVNWTFRRVQSL